MAISKDDRAEVIRMMREMLVDLSKGMHSPTRRVRRKSSFEDTEEAAEELGDEIEDLTKTIKKLQETSKDTEQGVGEYNDLINKASQALKASSRSLKSLDDEVDKLAHRDMLEQRDYLHRYSQTVNSLTTELGKQIRRSSLFGASLLSSHSKIETGSTSYHEMIHELTQASGGLNRGLLKAAGAWNDSTKSIKEDLNPDAFARLRLTMDDARTSFAEAFGSLGKFGFGSFDDVLQKGEMELTDMFKTFNQTSDASSELKDTMLKLAAEMSAKGFDVGANITSPTGEINPEVFDRLKSSEGAGELVNVIKNMASIAKQGENYANQTNDIAAVANSAIGKWVFGIRSAQREFGPFKGALFALRTKLAETATIAASMHMFKDGVRQAYKELTNFNIANIPKSFANVQMASVRLGMSFEETVKFFSQNRRVMAIYGPEFDKFTGKLGESFRRVGFNFEQAASAFEPLVASARYAAVNIRDMDGVTNFANQMATSFQRMNTMTEITVEEFARLNAQLLGSEDIQKTLLGMDQRSAQQRALELIQTRERYVMNGLSLEQAQELLKAQQAQQREAVVSRMRGAARAMMLAGQAGLSQQEQMRVFTLARKGRRSKQEDEELVDILKRVSAGVEEGIQRGYDQSEGSGDIRAETTRILQDGLGGISSIYDKATEMAVAERAKAGLKEAELDQSAALALGSEEVGRFSQIINSISSFFDNSFTKALFGGTAAVTGLAIASTRAAATLSLMGGGRGLIGRVAGKLLPRAGVGGLVRGAGRLLGLGAGAAALTAAAPTAAHAAVGLADDIAVPAASTALKSGGKFLGKAVLKKIPILGLLAGGAFAAQRAFAGDWAGAGMELASGAAGTIPGIGTAASIGIDAALMARDIHRANQEAQVTEASITPPSISQPATSTTTAGVNTPAAAREEEEEPFQTVEVQDMTAHEYLAKIAMGMTQAVDLLKALAETGNPAAMEAVAAQLRQQGMRQIPTVNSYITGRQAAP